MELVHDVDDLTRRAEELRRNGKGIGLVPTMGFLHKGHASLMKLARARCDQLIVSIYVNPLQFGPDEDLQRYPRDLPGDLKLCEQQDVDWVFAPKDLYPDEFSTSVSVMGLTDGLCGASRPGHFDGVATVCARLFGVTRSALAVFGDKDFQQLMVMRRMVRDLGMPVRIVPGPLIRDDDGVAFSSRNKYLSPEARTRARTLHQALFAMAAAVEGGQRDAEHLMALGRERVVCDRLDYLEVVDAETLKPTPSVAHRPARAMVAAYYGNTRLIDNVALRPELRW